MMFLVEKEQLKKIDFVCKYELHLTALFTGLYEKSY